MIGPQHHAGIDTSLKEGIVRAVDMTGNVFREAKAAGEAEAVAVAVAWYFDEPELSVCRIERNAA